MSEDMCRAREKLKRWGSLMEECRNRQRQIDSINALMRDAKYRGVEIESSATKVYEKKVAQLSEEIEELMQEKDKLDGLISGLGTIEKRIMIMRYVDRRSWDYINAMTGYSRRQCFRIHNEGSVKLLEKQ